MLDLLILLTRIGEDLSLLNLKPTGNIYVPPKNYVVHPNEEAKTDSTGLNKCFLSCMWRNLLIRSSHCNSSLNRRHLPLTTLTSCTWHTCRWHHRCLQEDMLCLYLESNLCDILGVNPLRFPVVLSVGRQGGHNLSVSMANILSDRS
jgi:hypothetical protein